MKQLLAAVWIGSGLSMQVAAQEPIWVNLFSSPDVSTEIASETGFYISQVIDARPGYSRIGFIQRENVPVFVQLASEGGIEKQVHAFFARYQPVWTGYQPIVVKINRMWVSEYTTAYEMGTAAVALDFFAERSDGWVCLFQSFAFVQAEGIDVLQLHEPNLIRALYQCLEQFRTSNWRATLTQATIHTAKTGTVSTPQAVQTDVLVVVQPLPKKGLYHTFVDFKNNQPDSTIPLLVKDRSHLGTRQHKLSLYYEWPDRDQDQVEEAWGFSDGKQAYIHFQKEYFLLRPVEGGFVFDAYPMPEAYTPMRSGLLDGGLTGALASLMHVNHRQSYFLDVYTGQITVWHPEITNPQTVSATTHTAQTPPTHLIMYYKPSKRTLQKPVRVVVSDRRQTVRKELRPGSYVQIAWEGDDSELTVCVEDSLSPCYTLVLEKREHYLEYHPVHTKEEIALRSVGYREALLYLSPMGYQEIQVYGNTHRQSDSIK